MRILVQRVSRARVTVDDQVVGEIGPGMVLLVGVGQGDGSTQVEKLAKKIATLRIYRDEEGRMNRSLLDVGGGALVISQFTLYADVRKGRRPSYIGAARPEQAEPLVDALAARLRALGVQPVATGRFGAMMMVELVNDGPVTIWIDSEAL